MRKSKKYSNIEFESSFNEENFKKGLINNCFIFYEIWLNEKIKDSKIIPRFKENILKIEPSELDKIKKYFSNENPEFYQRVFIE